jgi:creatinine amidohydrolase/Fe(II)-dependent formamide hydrolase-like protein
MREITPSGLQGDPKLATRETGEKLYEFVVDWLCRVIKVEFIES